MSKKESAVRLATRIGVTFCAILILQTWASASPVKDVIPVTPARPGRDVEQTTPNDADTDQALLNETAADLEEAPPSKRLDLQILNYFGFRSTLEQAGLTINSVWTVDYSKPLQGGLDTRDDATRNLLDLRLLYDTKAGFGFNGGTASIDFQNQAGRNGTGFVGDVQGFDNIDADGRTQISELWYQQRLFDDRLRIKIGKVDANTEFAFPDFGGGFINSSIGHSPTITALPTYPDGASSANLFVYPTRWSYLGAGVYDGSLLDGVQTGSYGPARLFHSGESFFYIAEAGARWHFKDQTLPGHFGIGGHYHSGIFETFDGGNQRGASGLYLTLEQKLFHRRFYDKTNPEGLYAEFQYGHADRHVSKVVDYVSGGLVFTGPYEKTNPDSIGVAVEAAHLTDAVGAGFTRSFETDVEAYYNFQATSYLAIKPDLEYILNPGGSASVKDAIVLTLRGTLSF